VCINLSDFGVENLSSPKDIRNAMKIEEPVSKSTIHILEKYRYDALKYYFQRTKLDIFALISRKERFIRYNMTPQMWLEERFPKTKNLDFNKTRKSDFFSICKRGDALMNFDSSWLPLHEKTFERAKESGVTCFTLVYDLIPILMPNVTHGMMPLIFHNWLLNSAKYTNRYISISNATKDDLLIFFKNYKLNFDVHTLPLVQQRISNDIQPFQTGPLLKDVNKESYSWLYEVAEISDNIRNIATTPYVLCAGTIEARKNVWRIALCWKMLLEKGNHKLPRLIFAGRKGWLIQPLENLLQATGNLYGWIEIVDGPNDDELAFLYRNCKFTIMASLYEGWGLPVGEALSYGKTAVVADNSSLPEVGGDMVEYCDAESIESIAAACERLIDNPQRLQELERKIRETRLRNWDDVCRELMDIIVTD
ncbi:MAG: hypothetical protein RIR97_385, partial [Pseudomonadota bacterium]